MGNDWYPIVIDSYTTAEYANLDAYLASEYGRIFLAYCGVSALVPLATATQRLADNGINITVHDIQPLNDRTYNGGSRRYLVDNNGRIATFVEVDVNCFYRDDPEGDYITSWASELPQEIAAWGTSIVSRWNEGEVNTFTVGGVTYTLTPEGNHYRLSPAAGTYDQ